MERPLRSRCSRRTFARRAFSCRSALVLGFALAGVPTSALAQSSTPELILGRPTDTSITVSVFATDGSVVLEYGPTDSFGSSTASTPLSSSRPAKLVLSGLTPNTRYYYRTRFTPTGSTTETLGTSFSFTTQRGVGSSFVFDVQSDSHQGYQPFYNEALYNVTLGNIAADAPDFLFDLGDSVSTDDATEDETTVRGKYLRQRTSLSRVASSVPLFQVLGNHENEEGWNLDDAVDVSQTLPVLGANARKRYFVNPIPNQFYSGNTDASLQALDGDHLKEDYYAFEWGDALFVSIDPYWYTMRKPYAGTTGGEGADEREDDPARSRWDWTLGQQQYEWLRSTLENSNARYKFVFAHQLVGGSEDYGRGGAYAAQYAEWGGYDPDGVSYNFDRNRPGFVAPIQDLFEANGVSIMFHGHDHAFATDHYKGVTYQLCPHAANAGFGTGFGSNATEYPEGVIANSGHLRVSVAPESLKVEYVRAFRSRDTQGTNRSVASTYALAPLAATNRKPTATDDAAQIVMGATLPIPVLSNDTDDDGDTLQVVGASQGSARLGVVTLLPSGAVQYAASTSACGTDTFRYAVKDGKGGSRTAAVTVSVGCSTGPVATLDRVTTRRGQAVNIAVLANDQAPDSTFDLNTLSVVTQPSRGVVVPGALASELNYTPPAGYVGADSFSYEICDDWGRCATGEVEIAVEPGLCPNDPDCAAPSATASALPSSSATLPSSSTTASAGLSALPSSSTTASAGLSALPSSSATLPSNSEPSSLPSGAPSAVQSGALASSSLTSSDPGVPAATVASNPSAALSASVVDPSPLLSAANASASSLETTSDPATSASMHATEVTSSIEDAGADASVGEASEAPVNTNEEPDATAAETPTGETPSATAVASLTHKASSSPDVSMRILPLTPDAGSILPPANADESCSCNTVGRASSGRWSGSAWLLGVVAALGLTRRRRQQQPRS